MLAYLDANSPRAPGAYLLVPVSKRRRAQHRARTGGDSILYQTDWDFPCLAELLGWDGRSEGVSRIAAATAWLDAHDGIVRRVDEELFEELFV